MGNYAEIIIDRVSDAVDRPFHYRIPDQFAGQIQPGSAVRVPFGGSRLQGYVLRLLESPAVNPVKDIIEPLAAEPVLNREQLALVHWLAHRYFCRKIEAIRAVLPGGFRSGKTVSGPTRLALTAAAAGADLAGAPAQRRIVSVLMDRGPLPVAELLRLSEGASRSAVYALLKKGLVKQESGALPAPPGAGNTPAAPLKLTAEQNAAFQKLCRALDSGSAARLVLHGVTGSGKTEIYLQGIARCLEKGGGAIVLVPEIALTPQMVERFTARFPGRLAVLHSRLTAAERAVEWQRIRAGKARVVLGARSAVFAPLEKPGLIIIDEEHETTYKQDDSPRYQAREVAWWRARYHRAVLLTGSATPSLESYYQCSRGQACLLELPSRAAGARLPAVTVVDMRWEMKEGHRHIFSRPLLSALAAVVERGEQAILFLNRRGFAGFVLCRECGYVVRCANCAVSMTLHLDRGSLVCHYCSRQVPIPQTCPACGGVYIRWFGTGTQRVEAEVRKLFPAVPVIRMDSDTTARRGAHQALYRQFRDGRAQILVGTQMIAKGFDFPGVTLVGVVTADTALNLPDFRAAERTFQLLTQVSGRAGRGAREGRVIIQTYHPGHDSIQAAAAHDFTLFYQNELARRRELAYPPFSDLLRFLFVGEEEAAVREAADAFTGRLEQFQWAGELLGPAPAAIYRLKTFYRVHTILKGKNLPALFPALRKVIRDFRSGQAVRKTRLLVDFNPQVVL